MLLWQEMVEGPAPSSRWRGNICLVNSNGEAWSNEYTGTNKVLFGKHCELSYLPPKMANFLHEFGGDDFPSLGLPPLPSDRTRLDVHAILRPLNIGRLLRRRLVVIIMCRNT